MEQLLQQIGGTTAIVLSGLTAVLLLIVFLLWLKINAIGNKYYLFMKGSSRTSLEQRLIEYQEEMSDIRTQLGDISRRLAFVEQMQPGYMQKTGLIRYNAFDDVGSDLSFALALLNEHGDGFILSSLYARDETRIYAKPVEKGLSTYQLTEEEQSAIDKAQKE
ncbi:DUF4446 family protein [Metallumcola ferriviriculae]|uniref:DUF4446 family protein n=1 Tax=Metallumcola ferriviriculae TaxID=3039180 RepID=A0ABZ1BAJ5_9FIRM|nr:DUF4446 family protein [Desulfitibacteraceae bacterium MK1]